MIYKYVMSEFDLGAVELVLRWDEEPLSVGENSALIEVARCAVDVPQVAQMLRQGQGWKDVNRFSLVGHVARHGQGGDGVRAGDCVVAFGPLVNRITLPVHECLVVPRGVDVDQAACWALVVELIYHLRRICVEVGEQVLVLGDGLTGLLMAQLAFAAGASVTVGVNAERPNPDLTAIQTGPGFDLLWLANERATYDTLLDHEVDVLIDTFGDFELLKHMIPLVRDGGRVLHLMVQDQRPVDFDFYPDIHRRSLKLLGGSIGGPIQQMHIGEDKDAKFVQHLFATRRLRPEYLQRVRPRASKDTTSGSILLKPEARALLVEW
jgi:NADPH:quinone reductase-like Zn-dependent oxidoreductase